MEASALAFLLSMSTSELLRRAREENINIVSLGGDTYEVDEFQALRLLSEPPQTPGQFINDLLCAQGKTWDCLKEYIRGGKSQIKKLMIGKLALSEHLILHMSRTLNVPESEFWKAQRRWDNYNKPFGSHSRPIKRERRAVS